MGGTVLVNESSTNNIGWIILTGILAATTLVFLMLWIFTQSTVPSTSSNVCFGSFGVQADVDANPLNLCGMNQNNPCVFAINTLAGAEDQCNTLESICNAFTFNQNTNTMKIVQLGNTFSSLSTNLFVRQTSSISS